MVYLYRKYNCLNLKGLTWKSLNGVLVSIIGDVIRCGPLRSRSQDGQNTASGAIKRYVSCIIIIIIVILILLHRISIIVSYSKLCSLLFYFHRAILK